MRQKEGPQEVPRIVVLSGPNGSGKSTSARAILQGPLKVDEFVNADTIAQGLSAFDPEGASIAAGRVMLSRLRELAARRSSFAFETTLASRTFASWILELIQTGYEFHLVFLWLPSADAAVARVSDRVKRGGHSVPEATVRRRYKAGLKNFISLYQPLATTWQVIDNSGIAPKVIAACRRGDTEISFDSSLWHKLAEEAQK